MSTPETPTPGPSAPTLPARRPWRVVWAAAALFGIAIVVRNMRTAPDVVAHPPSNRLLAESDRDRAEASCAQRDWATCKKLLDEAVKLDPGGETEPRVQKWRDETAFWMSIHPADGGMP